MEKLAPYFTLRAQRFNLYPFYLGCIVGLDICGIDIMTPNLKVPITENGDSLLEVNAAPGFRGYIP